MGRWKCEKLEELVEPGKCELLGGRGNGGQFGKLRGWRVKVALSVNNLSYWGVGGIVYSARFIR